MFDTKQIQPRKAEPVKKQDKKTSENNDLPEAELFTLASLHQPETQAMADLEWQIRFTQMKLNLWRDLDNGKWDTLKQLNKDAKRELNWLKAV